MNQANIIKSLVIGVLLVGGVSIPAFETYNMNAVEYTQYIEIINNHVKNYGKIILQVDGVVTEQKIREGVNVKLLEHITDQGKIDLIKKTETLQRESLINKIL